MAAKTSALTALTAVDVADLVFVVDVSDTTMAASGTNKKVTIANFFGATTPVAGAFTTLSASSTSAFTGAFSTESFGHADGAYNPVYFGSGSTQAGAIIAISGNAGADAVTINNAGLLAWSSGSTADLTAKDTILLRDAANTLALRNGAADQAFRVYGLYTDASNYHYGSFAMSDTGLTISTATAGTGVDNLDITLTPSGTGSVKLTTATKFRWSGSTVLIDSFDGGIELRNNAEGVGAHFGACAAGLAIGAGSSASFPALKRSTTTLQIRLADDSAFAPIACSNITHSGPEIATSVSGGAVSASGTITTAGVTTTRVTAAGAVASVIMQAGTVDGQKITVIHESVAANTITMAAAATSNVADGVGTVIAGLTAVSFIWNSNTSRWYHEK